MTNSDHGCKVGTIKSYDLDSQLNFAEKFLIIHPFFVCSEQEKKLLFVN